MTLTPEVCDLLLACRKVYGSSKILANLHTSSKAPKSHVVVGGRGHSLLLYAYRAFCTQSYGIVFYHILEIVSSNSENGITNYIWKCYLEN